VWWFPQMAHTLSRPSINLGRSEIADQYLDPVERGGYVVNEEMSADHIGSTTVRRDTVTEVAGDLIHG